MTLESMLESLREGWNVELSNVAGVTLEWKLVIVDRRDSWRAFTYRGTLASVVRRAWAGERGDLG